jgi:hypothetical protein
VIALIFGKVWEGDRFTSGEFVHLEQGKIVARSILGRRIDSRAIPGGRSSSGRVHRGRIPDGNEVIRTSDRAHKTAICEQTLPNIETPRFSLTSHAVIGQNYD